MSASPKWIPELASEAGFGALLTPIRREQRNDEVRITEYTPFPRMSADQRPRLGFTRDISQLGMCLGVDERERVGALLRVNVRRIDGRSLGASIARVVWCTAARDGRYWLGLDLLCETGGGRNAERATFLRRSTEATERTPTARAPYARVPGSATKRSATSFWTISTSSAGLGRRRRRKIRGVVIVYGMLPMTLRRWGWSMRDE